MVNGILRQRSSTSEMIFDVPSLVSYVSQFMTLLPGDIISTGTPAGVGLGMNPPQCLKAGDVVELGIDGLGESRQKVVPWNSICLLCYGVCFRSDEGFFSRVPGFNAPFCRS
jgi:2-keto-4-pentenoate hydratase/2-oxohepta-3-ene-1,7-dioic acid hydratase in catechol pathway